VAAADFPLLPHIASARGMFRVFAKQLHPRFELYVSPVNVDPEEPALPISTPGSYAREVAAGMEGVHAGHSGNTSALRQGVFDLPEFLSAEPSRPRRGAASSGRFTAAIYGWPAVFLFLVGRSEFPCAVGQARCGVTGYISRGGSIHRRSHAPRTRSRTDGDVGPWLRRVQPRRQLNTWLVSRGLRTKAYALGLNVFTFWISASSRRCGGNSLTFATPQTDTG